MDYIDRDDYMTPFKWDTVASTPHWVYGTEVTQVLLNEGYVEYRTDMMTGQITEVQVWAELFNPMKATPGLAGSGTAKLDWSPGTPTPNTSIYRLAVCRPVDQLNNRIDEFLLRRDNVRGTPDNSGANPDPQLPALNFIYMSGGNPCIVDRFNVPPGATIPANGEKQIQPTNPYGTAPGGNGPSNAGYYLLGPDTGMPTALGTSQPMGVSPALRYVPDNRVVADFVANEKPTLVLQRLACPHLPNQPDPAQANYNPYITTDYMLAVRNDNVIGTVGNSTARAQPYQAGQPTSGPPSMYAGNGQGAAPTCDWFGTSRPAAAEPHGALARVRLQAARARARRVRFVQAAMGQPTKFQHLAPGSTTTCLTPRAAPRSPPASTGPWSSWGRAPGAGLRAAPNRGDRDRHHDDDSDPDRPGNAGINPSGTAWNIQEDMVLILEPGSANQENVRVLASTINGKSFRVKDPLIKPHTAPVTVMVPVLNDRIPGKININTVWDPETLDALADARRRRTGSTGHGHHQPGPGPGEGYEDVVGQAGERAHAEPAQQHRQQRGERLAGQPRGRDPGCRRAVPEPDRRLSSERGYAISQWRGCEGHALPGGFDQLEPPADSDPGVLSGAAVVPQRRQRGWPPLLEGRDPEQGGQQPDHAE